jgi:hypothetical protein
MHLRGFVVVGCIKKNPSVFEQTMDVFRWSADGQADGFITLCALGSSLLHTFVAFLLGTQQKIRVSGLLNTYFSFCISVSVRV